MDELGLEGLSSDFSFELDSRPKTAKPIGTQEDESSTETRPEFRWQSVKGAKGYRLQLARDWSFSEIILDVYVDAADYYKISNSQQGLPPNSYYWRVASVDKAGNTSSFSVPKVAVVRSAPATERGTVSQ